MIIIKQLLFQLLDELKPNELLQVKINNGHRIICLANKESIFPLATEMRMQIEDDAVYRDYASAYDYNDSYSYELKYYEDHTVHLNNREFLITEELLDIVYDDDYFTITISNLDGVFKDYFKYNDITSIRTTHTTHRSYLADYNELNYKYKTNKN